MFLSNPLVDILNPPKEKEGKYRQVLEQEWNSNYTPKIKINSQKKKSKEEKKEKENISEPPYGISKGSSLPNSFYKGIEGPRIDRGFEENQPLWLMAFASRLSEGSTPYN